eukprot:3135526-Amphidinium_carterae.1
MILRALPRPWCRRLSARRGAAVREQCDEFLWCLIPIGPCSSYGCLVPDCAEARTLVGLMSRAHATLGMLHQSTQLGQGFAPKTRAEEHGWCKRQTSPLDPMSFSQECSIVLSPRCSLMGSVKGYPETEENGASESLRTKLVKMVSGAEAHSCVTAHDNQAVYSPRAYHYAMAVAFTHSPYTRQGCAATSVPAARPRLSSGCNLHTKPLFGCLATAALVASRTLKHKAHRQRRGAFQLASTQDDMCSDYLRFVNKTGSPAHTVAAAKELLLEAGFTELSDTGPLWATAPPPSAQSCCKAAKASSATGAAWVLEPGNGYFVTMQGTSIAAFGVGEQFGDGTSGGVVVAAAHTDSPCLKLRPCSKLPTKVILA